MEWDSKRILIRIVVSRDLYWSMHILGEQLQSCCDVSLQKVCVLNWSMHVLGSEYGSVVTVVVLLQRVCVVQPGEHDVRGAEVAKPAHFGRPEGVPGLLQHQLGGPLLPLGGRPPPA